MSFCEYVIVTSTVSKRRYQAIKEEVIYIYIYIFCVLCSLCFVYLVTSLIQVENKIKKSPPPAGERKYSLKIARR